KLLDWGMAHIAGERDPLRGMVAGTLAYVAPEQLRGDDVAPAADIYALAVLAYVLLLGGPPFTSRSELELIHKHLHDAPPRPRATWAGAPAALDALLVAMLAKRPDQRPELAEVVRVLRDARDQLRPRQRRWYEPPELPAADVLGRPIGVLGATPR